MRFRRAIVSTILAFICLALCACGPGNALSTPAGVQAPASSSASPPPSPTPTPTPAPSPTPVPTPKPTPTPDPWADQFHTSGGAYVSVKDAVSGPWIYKDANIGITIRFQRGGPKNHSFYLADIYARRAILGSGFAFQSDRGRTELPYKIARRYDAVLGITADYFSHGANRKGVIIRNGVVYHDKKKNSTLAILPDGSLGVYDPGEIDAGRLLQMGVKDTFSFGPILVRDGAIDENSIKQHWLSKSADEYRAAIGQIEPGHYIVIVTRGSFTMRQLAQLFVDNHCVLAYNMDGGHSACMIFMGEQLNQHYPGSLDGVCQRPLPDIMLIGANAAVPDVKDKVFCNGVTVNAKYKPKPTEGIIPEGAEK